MPTDLMSRIEAALSFAASGRSDMSIRSPELGSYRFAIIHHEYASRKSEGDLHELNIGFRAN